MAVEMIGDTPKGSISDVKKSPMDIFKKSEESKQGVYILNRDNIAGVMLSQLQYEEMLNKIDRLEEQLLDYEVAKRIQAHDSQEKPDTYSLEQVMGPDLAKVEYDPEEDGWE